ncbi:Hypothetical protein FKW44_024378 [Caligus rogercresseyi]|uniref:Uncharacterized protein n=1 Tax=Caligus rogercresseyi TaxID=217165 RepID=A0A7T8GN60_CALRO|nr:Hypothetical protein FKW44_024378 [Caligus rogercresseyi]
MKSSLPTVEEDETPINLRVSMNEDMDELADAKKEPRISFTQMHLDTIYFGLG